MSDANLRSHSTVEAEPTVATATPPLWLIALLFVMFFCAAWSFDQRSGWFSRQVYGPYASLEAVQQFQPPAADEDPLYARGKVVFATCAACHQANGLGSTSVGAPPLVESEWVLASGPNRIVRIVLDGLAGPIKVKGQQYGTGVMTPFRAALSDEDIAAVLTYIRQNRDWKHNASNVTPEQVKAIREATKDRGTQWNEADLLKVSEN